MRLLGNELQPDGGFRQAVSRAEALTRAEGFRRYEPMMTEEMDAAATSASDLLKALASPNRLKILCHLVDGEKSVGEIASLIGIRETTVSQHLALLRKDRLVGSRRAGQTIFYRLESPIARRILEVLYENFCGRSPSPERHPGDTEA